MPQLLPTSEQDFERLITDGFVYVDKTEYVWKLVEMKSKYFLSRPRGIGKSLFVSTLDAYFLGKKELFKGNQTNLKESVKQLRDGKGKLDEMLENKNNYQEKMLWDLMQKITQFRK